MSSILQIRSALPLGTPGQAHSSAPAHAANVPHAAALYDPDALAKAAGAFSGSRITMSPDYVLPNKTYVLDQLDAADKYAQMAFLCMQEGNTAKAQQYMQYATDIRKSVEPLLTCAQKKSLEDIIRLQQDALQKMGSGSLADFLQAFFERAQAGAESAGLRNSIESGWQNKQPSPPWYAHPLALR